MPTEYIIDAGRAMVLSRAWGTIQRGEFIAHGRSLLTDPAFKPHFRQFWDLSTVTQLETDYSGVTELADVRVFAPETRRAILAPTDVIFGLARMFQMMRESKGETGIRVFRDREEAMQWLETGTEPAAPARVASASPIKNSRPRA